RWRPGRRSPDAGRPCGRAGEIPAILLARYLPARICAAQVQSRRDPRLLVARLRARRETRASIQEDETALIIWALWQYFELYQRIEETAPFYRTLVTRPADFMLGYVDPATGLPLPSHDLWEERWGVHAFTVAAGIAGLRADARLTEAFGEPERA